LRLFNDEIHLRVRYVMNNFENKSFMQSMRRLEHAFTRGSIFPLLEGRGEAGRGGKRSFPFFSMCSHHVLIKLLLSSQRIPQVLKFPKMFPKGSPSSLVVP
jgi:hypothetical protein